MPQFSAAMKANGRTAQRASTARSASAAADRHPQMFDLAPGARTGVTRRNARHWVYVVAGSGVVQRNGAPITLKRGTLVVIQPNERHEIVNDGAEALRAISVNSTFAESVPARRWLGGTGATLAASAVIASCLASLFYRLVG